MEPLCAGLRVSNASSWVCVSAPTRPPPPRAGSGGLDFAACSDWSITQIRGGASSGLLGLAVQGSISNVCRGAGLGVFPAGGAFTAPGLDYLRNLCDSLRLCDLSWGWPVVGGGQCGMRMGPWLAVRKSVCPVLLRSSLPAALRQELPGARGGTRALLPAF